MTLQDTATATDIGTLQALLPSWRRSLRAANKAPRTIETYTLAADQFIAYLQEHGMPLRADLVHREHVEAFIAHVLDTRSASTARQRPGSLLQLWKWLEEEGEITSSPMAKMSPPKVPEQPIPVLSNDQLAKLLDATKARTPVARRDHAIIRLFIDTGVRLTELADLAVEDIDLDLNVAVVMGKGRRPRTVPFGNRTALAIDRYLRSRVAHHGGGERWLWLGKKGRLGRSGIYQLIRRRGREAGIEDLHPHMFRHTFAHRWLAAGGQEGDLQRIAGWKDRQMVARYGQSAATERAQEAHRRLALGDQL